MSAPETPISTPEARKYVAFSHTFEDPWGEGDEESEVKCAFRFAKPNKVQIKRLQDTAAKNAANASRNLLPSIPYIPTTRPRWHRRWKTIPALPPRFPGQSSKAWASATSWESSLIPL